MKIQVTLLLVAFLLGVTILGCQDIKDQVRNKEVVINKKDVKKFKTELESLNEKNDVKVKINDSSRIVYAKEQDVLNLKNGIVLFGWPSCPWFRNAIEPLLQFAAREHATIYFLNIKDIRDKKELKKGKVVTIDTGSVGYNAILKKFHDILNPYKTLQIDSIKRISSPTVLFIENGKAVFKVASTVISQKDAHVKLNAKQQKELIGRYQAYFTQEKK